ncbi:hypothetical protein [Streptomyces sp. DHE17-7]|uniref:hypothetical protein n=1 Tax=Streptomyces sp. DHE17-7 TaxID=2759949 RepID=UPI003FA78430
MLILGTAGAGYLYYEHLNGNIEKGERSSGDSKADRPEPNAAGQTPLNILPVGPTAAPPTPTWPWAAAGTTATTRRWVTCRCSSTWRNKQAKPV